MKPIIEVAVNGAREQPVSEHDADQRQRDRRQDHQRQLEAAELRHHQDVDPSIATPNAAPMSRNVT